MNVACTTETCPLVLNSKCVFYESSALPYIGIATNDTIELALQKIELVIKDIFDTGVGAVWGTIVGSITNQTDLVTYITNTINTASGSYWKVAGITDLTANATINAPEDVTVTFNFISSVGLINTSRVQYTPNNLYFEARSLTDNTFGNINIDVSSAHLQAVTTLGNSLFEVSTTGVIVNSSLAGFAGIQEFADYSPNYTDLSHTNRGYVLGPKTFTGSQTFRAGTATVGTAPVYLVSGVALTTPANGALEYHNSHLYFTIGGTRYQLDQQAITDGNKGDITVTAAGTIWTINNDVVVFAKMQNIATNKVLGRTTAGTGDVEEITVGLTTHVSGILPIANGGTGLGVIGAANTILKVNSLGTLLEFGTFGSNTQVIYNSGGVLSGSASLTFDGSSLNAKSVLITAFDNSIGLQVLNDTLNTLFSVGESAGATRIVLNVGGDATGDIYYRHSDGKITRLGVGTNTHVLTLAGGLPTWAAPSAGGGGITNTAAVNEMMKSDGTNAVPSGTFSTTLGDLTFGTGLTGTTRSILASGTGATVDLILRVTDTSTATDVLRLTRPGGAPQVLFPQTPSTSTIITTNISGSHGGSLQISTASAIGTNINSGNVGITAGSPTGTGTGGNVNIYAGTGGTIDLVTTNNGVIHLSPNAITYGAVGLGTNTPSAPIHAQGITSNLSGPATIFKISHSPSNTSTSGVGVGMDFETRTGASTFKIGSVIQSVSTNIGVGTEAFDLVFRTMSAGSAATSKFVITGNGRIYGTNLHNNAAAITGTTNQYIASGTWTPVITNPTNLTSHTAGLFQFTRVGNVVTFSGAFLLDPTATGAVTFDFSLPIPSAFTNTGQLSGTLVSWTTSQFGAIRGDFTNDLGEVMIVTTDAAELNYHCSGSYLIV